MASDLSGTRILLTSGPTRANIDEMRFISNRSSGRLGASIAVEALALGASVTMIQGPGAASPPADELSAEERRRLRTLHIETVFDLVEALNAELTGGTHYEALVHAMAVLDYVPESHEGKVPSGREEWNLRLRPTPKVIQKIKEWSPRTFLVGFKLEVGKDDDRLRQAATALIRRSRADLVVANDLKRIRDKQHPALLVGRSGRVLARPSSKGEIARELCKTLARALA